MAAGNHAQTYSAPSSRSRIAEREEKDFADIVNLVIENNLDPKLDLREICREYGTTDIYARIEERLRELRHD